MEKYNNYEKKSDNIDGIPVSSRRSFEELALLEYMKLREEIESHYKEIRNKKRKLELLVNASQSIKELDARLRKIPRQEEEKKRKREEVPPENEQEKTEEKGDPTKKKKKLKNAISKKKQTHRSYLQQGYTMTEQEIEEEGGEKSKQYVYFKDLGDNKSSVHVMKGIEGLKLSSTLGDEDQEMILEK